MQCTENEELPPFFDELYLEYDVGKGYKLIYNFHMIEDNKFKIIEIDETGFSGKDIEEFYINRHGKVYKSSKEIYEGGFSPIWIPVHEMEIGDTVDDYKVVRKDKWKKWEVLVVKNPDFQVEKYFELNTGFLVGVKGRFGMAYEITLVDTNADIPTIED